MKLYYSPGACSLSVHIALREAGRPFDLVKVDLPRHALPDGRSYLEVSPRGYVPLIELDDGTRHTEVAALLQMVADEDPHYALIGAPRSAHRHAVTQWLVFVATELHRSFAWLWRKDTADSTVATVKDKLALRLAELDRHLSTRAYLAGDFSVADAYAFTIVNWANALRLPLSPYPQVQAYLGRMTARPAVQAALRAEGLLA